MPTVDLVASSQAHESLTLDFYRGDYSVNGPKAENVFVHSPVNVANIVNLVGVSQGEKLLSLDFIKNEYYSRRNPLFIMNPIVFATIYANAQSNSYASINILASARISASFSGVSNTNIELKCIAYSDFSISSYSYPELKLKADGNINSLSGGQSETSFSFKAESNFDFQSDGVSIVQPYLKAAAQTSSVSISSSNLYCVGSSYNIKETVFYGTTLDIDQRIFYVRI